ncbi:barttin [Amia ocellicauda]|uniref:barttin n=1 Tax=Amia ocellicauda TaxID=2972642 RepID=UPI003464BBA0
MAGGKQYRHSLIVLGLFLVAMGMFFMNVEEPQVYATFCAVGGLMVLIGVIWSMCQCYPKVTLSPYFEEQDEFLTSEKLKLCPGAAETAALEQKSSPEQQTMAPLAGFHTKADSEVHSDLAPQGPAPTQAQTQTRQDLEKWASGHRQPSWEDIGMIDCESRQSSEEPSGAQAEPRPPRRDSGSEPAELYYGIVEEPCHVGSDLDSELGDRR